VTASLTLSTLGRRALILVPALIGAAVLLLVLELLPSPGVDPDRIWLLHAMVLVKGLVWLAAARVIYWRLGEPISRSLALGYSACLAVSAAALAWLWGVYLFAIGAAFFWGALFGILLVARKDPLVAEVKTAQTP
jgi:hypothetical protein